MFRFNTLQVLLQGLQGDIVILVFLAVDVRGFLDRGDFLFYQLQLFMEVVALAVNFRVECLGVIEIRVVTITEEIVVCLDLAKVAERLVHVPFTMWLREELATPAKNVHGSNCCRIRLHH